MRGILIEAFSQKEIVWTLPLGTLRYQKILLVSVLNPPKEYQISYSTSIILTMVITEEFHICIWHLDSLWIMILLIFYILPVLLVDAELGIYFHLQIREQLFRTSYLENFLKFPRCHCRGTFRSLPNICDETCCKNNYKCFCKTFHNICLTGF